MIGKGQSNYLNSPSPDPIEAAARAPKIVVMYDDPERQVSLLMGYRRKASADKTLEQVLTMARERPQDAAKWLELSCLRAMAGLNREANAEHVKRTGREAGGGTLTKGS